MTKVDPAMRSVSVLKKAILKYSREVCGDAVTRPSRAEMMSIGS